MCLNNYTERDLNFTFIIIVKTMEILEYLSLPFVQKTLFVGVILAALAGVMGVLSTIRNASFFGDAVAHSSLAGVAIGLWFNYEPLFVALVYAVAVSVMLPWFRKNTNFAFDTILGIFLPFSMGLGVVIFSALPGYQPDLMSFLFGSMLGVTFNDVLFVLVLAVIFGITLAIFFHQLLYIAIDPEYPRIIGLRTELLDIMFHVLLACTIIAGVRLVGVILINALIIIPASIARLYASSLTQMLILAPIIGVVCVLIGILFSLMMNTPPGASIGVVSGTAFFASVVFQRVVRR